MTFPNWFRVTWWILLLAALTTLLFRRLQDLLVGNATPFDVVAFIIWVSLMLVPLFSEIKILGFEFKQKIEELRRHIDQQVVSLRSDIQTNVELRSQINPQFNFMQPPPDAQLPKLEESIRKAIKNEFENAGRTVPPSPPKSEQELADVDTIYLFSVRRSIELELRRLYQNALGDDAASQRGTAIYYLNKLGAFEIVSRDLRDAIRKVYAVCSSAIHGENPTPEQVRFVKEVAPDLLGALRSLE